MIIVDDKIAIEVPKKVQVKGIYIPEAHKTIGLVEGTVIKVETLNNGQQITSKIIK